MATELTLPAVAGLAAEILAPIAVPDVAVDVGPEDYVRMAEGAAAALVRLPDMLRHSAAGAEECLYAAARVADTAAILVARGAADPNVEFGAEKLTANRFTTSLVWNFYAMLEELAATQQEATDADD